ncbi:MAG: hypothetical protein JST34_04110, partial [Bacteroidetes bacterium]|nr:hypothetical protein [Bacteroidota bacterium]
HGNGYGHYSYRYGDGHGYGYGYGGSGYGYYTTDESKVGWRNGWGLFNRIRKMFGKK